MYADDTQLYLNFDPRDKNSSIVCINACIKNRKMWLCANRLCINGSKTEALLISKMETVVTSIQNGVMTIPLLLSVTNLGAKIDNRCDIESTHSKCAQTHAFICRVFVKSEGVYQWKVAKYWFFTCHKQTGLCKHR